MDVATCHCGKRCKLKTSWTDYNPGRRFLSCSRYGSVGACGFFVWVDPPLCARARQIIPELLRRTNELQGQLQVHRRREKWLIVCIVISWIVLWWWQGKTGGDGSGNGIDNVNEKGDGMYLQLG